MEPTNNDTTTRIRDNAWAVLPEKVQRLLNSGPTLGYTFSRCVVPISGVDQEGRPVGGSGFIVAVGEHPPKGVPEFYLVTARHIAEVAQMANLALTIIVRLTPKDLRARLFPTIQIALDNDRWIHGTSDVSVMPFPLDQLPEDHEQSAVHHGVFVTKRPLYYSTATDLELYGRWTISQGGAIVVVRHALLASFEQPDAMLDILPGAKTRCSVHLADGTVSRGMSGGLAALGSSGGMFSGGVLGLIHGYWPLGTEELGLDQPDQDAFRELQRQVGEINGRMVYIIPAAAIDELLDPIRDRLCP